MYESCVEPGHPHKAFAHHIRSVHWWSENVPCWYTNSSCDYAFIALFVQSIAPITLGKEALASNCASMLFDCIVGIWYTCWDADNSIPLGWHGLAQGRLAQSQSVGQLPLECSGCLNPGMSQLSSCASKSSLSLNTRSLPIAAFTMSSNTAKAAIVFNGMHCNTLRMLFYPLV